MYLLVNFEFDGNSMVEDILDNNSFKENAFNSKLKITNGNSKELQYNYVLIPVISANMEDQEFLLAAPHISQCSRLQDLSYDELFSIYITIKDVLHVAKKMGIDVVNRIDLNNLEILYSDGSSSKALGKASYGCCKLLERSDIAGDNWEIDQFSGLGYTYETFSGEIDDGTNNIGELTGIRTLINNLSDSKSYHLIISDSIYGLKSYREYIYNWSTNGYKTYSKKDIANKTLIIDTYNDLKEQNNKGHLVLFKWTRGHDNNVFNEICDKLAKEELGIKKGK